MEHNTDPVAPPMPPPSHYQAPSYPQQNPGVAYHRPGLKSPFLAALWACVIPGLGHIYVGVYQRALILFVIWLGVFSSAIYAKDGELGLLVPMTIFIWLFNVFDAYRQATFAVWGESEEELRATAGERGRSGLTFGITLFVVGLYGLLRRYFDIDLSLLFEHWYLVIMAVGGWLIWQAIAAKSSGASSAD